MKWHDVTDAGYEYPKITNPRTHTSDFLLLHIEYAYLYSTNEYHIGRFFSNNNVRCWYVDGLKDPLDVDDMYVQVCRWIELNNVLFEIELSDVYGKWEICMLPSNFYGCKCSICGNNAGLEAFANYEYCPYCGVKMLDNELGLSPDGMVDVDG